MKKNVALSIAGSDPSGGAGIQADLKAFSYLGIHGATVVTCVTAQNTKQVKTIYKIPVDIIEKQIETLFDDFSIDAVKTGMLYDEEIIRIILKKLKKYQIKPVIDPVMIATTGDKLMNHMFITSLQKELLPYALIVTANIPEASILSNMKITQWNEAEAASKILFQLGPKYVLLKGGHFKSDMAIDFLYDGKKFYKFALPKIPQRKAHGSGCTLSALITGLLAMGKSPVDAVEKAKYINWSMIKEGYSPGKGSDVLNHFYEVQIPPLVQNNEQFLVWLRLKNAINTMITFLPSQYIPEVGINFGYALSNAKTRNDVCAVNGRIIKQKNQSFLCGTLDFGVSKHVASIILTAMMFNATMRSAINIRYSQKTVKICKKIGLKIGSFNRENEPPNTTSTLEWGTHYATTSLNKVPDIIYDNGSIGKEPMIRILGKNPEDVLSKIKKLLTTSAT